MQDYTTCYDRLLSLLDICFYIIMFMIVMLLCVTPFFSSCSLLDYITYYNRLLRLLDTYFYVNIFVIALLLCVAIVFSLYSLTHCITNSNWWLRPLDMHICVNMFIVLHRHVTSCYRSCLRTLESFIVISYRRTDEWSICNTRRSSMSFSHNLLIQPVK